MVGGGLFPRSVNASSEAKPSGRGRVTDAINHNIYRMPAYIGMAMILGIIGGITGDVWYQHGSTPVVYAREPDPPRTILIETRIEWDEERIKKEVKDQADAYKVSYEQMWRTIQCESNGSSTIQSRHVKNGVREDSWGLVQIHLPAHLNVTKAQALDPKFAIEFMAKHFAQGGQRMWTCWREIYE